MMYDEVLALMFSFAASYSPYHGRLTATKQPALYLWRDKH
jgi:hypothetical protein